jgi:hypothetical protein
MHFKRTNMICLFLLICLAHGCEPTRCPLPTSTVNSTVWLSYPSGTDKLSFSRNIACLNSDEYEIFETEDGLVAIGKYDLVITKLSDSLISVQGHTRGLQFFSR